MTFSFETHALPLLLEMASDPLGPYDKDLVSELKRLGIESRHGRAAAIVDHLTSSGYISVVWDGGGQCTGRITTRGLQQLNLWPSDNERALYLASRMSQSFEEMANALAATPGSDPEEVSKLRTTAKGMLQFGGAVFAQVLATTITG